MARASGSYPAGRWFKSDIRYHSRPVGQAVKTRPFHGCNMGSIPVRVTMKKQTLHEGVCFFIYGVPYREPNTPPSAERDGDRVRAIAPPFRVGSLSGGANSRTSTLHHRSGAFLFLWSGDPYSHRTHYGYCRSRCTKIKLFRIV